MLKLLILILGLTPLVSAQHRPIERVRREPPRVIVKLALPPNAIQIAVAISTAPSGAVAGWSYDRGQPSSVSKNCMSAQIIPVATDDPSCLHETTIWVYDSIRAWKGSNAMRFTAYVSLRINRQTGELTGYDVATGPVH